MAADCMFRGSECLDVVTCGPDPGNSRGYSEAEFCQLQTRGLALCISLCNRVDYREIDRGLLASVQ